MRCSRDEPEEVTRMASITARKNLLGESVRRLGAVSLALGLLTVSASGAQRQDWSPRTPEQMVEEHLTRMTVELGLTDEQVVQVRPIIEEHLAKMGEFMEKHRQGGRRPGCSGREEMEALHKEVEERLDTVLTEEQIRTYREKQEERRERRRERTGRRGGGHPW